MKKFILVFITMFMFACGVNAQIATENRKAFDNVYAGVEAGVSTPLNFNSVNPLNTLVGIKLGKEFTPVYGIEVEGMASFGDNFYRYGVNGSIPAEGAFNIHKNGSVNTFVKATNIGLNGIINLSNLFSGYNGKPRIFEVKANTGFGWMHYFGNYTPCAPIGSYVVAGKQNTLTAKTALDLTFNIGSKRAHSFVVSPGVYWNLNEVGNIKFNKNYAQFGIIASYVYHFKTSNGTHYFKTYDVGAMMDEISRLNDELAKKPNEVVVEKIVEKPVLVERATGFGVKETIFFAFDSDELDDRAQKALDEIGTGASYRVDGYASNEGGTEYNLELSQRRADAVKAYLEGRGITVDEAVGHGIVFGPTTGRVVVVTNVK